MRYDFQVRRSMAATKAAQQGIWSCFVPDMYRMEGRLELLVDATKEPCVLLQS
jgi:hypothetical protein